MTTASTALEAFETQRTSEIANIEAEVRKNMKARDRKQTEVKDLNDAISRAMVILTMHTPESDFVKEYHENHPANVDTKKPAWAIPTPTIPSFVERIKERKEARRAEAHANADYEEVKTEKLSWSERINRFLTGRLLADILVFSLFGIGTLIGWFILGPIISDLIYSITDHRDGRDAGVFILVAVFGLVFGLGSAFFGWAIARFIKQFGQERASDSQHAHHTA